MKITKMDNKCNICGSRVREAREKAGISQDQLAARMQVLRIGINQNGISRIETGKRVVADFEVLSLSEALGVTPIWLLTGED